jgi:hypothetical protein
LEPGFAYKLLSSEECPFLREKIIQKMLIQHIIAMLYGSGIDYHLLVGPFRVAFDFVRALGLLGRIVEEYLILSMEKLLDLIQACVDTKSCNLSSLFIFLTLLFFQLLI